MEDFKKQIKDETVVAMKAKNQLRVDTLRSITAAITVAEKSVGNKVTNHIDILQTMSKQRKQSIEQFNNANYVEAANKEIAELAIIEEFLPKTMTDDDLKEAVTKVIAKLEYAVSIKEMGKVIAAFKEEYPGQDMGKVSKILKETLA